MQLAIDSLDRLVELLEERGGRVRASEAAAHLFAVRQAPEGLARSLLTPLVDQDARLAWRGDVRRAVHGARPGDRGGAFRRLRPRDDGSRAGVGADLRDRRGAGAASSRSATASRRSSQPRVPLPKPVGMLTGLSDAELRRAPGVRLALRRFSSFAGGAVLVAHNARFDVGFVNRELERMTGKRLHATVIDTVPLARNLLGRRSARTSLAALSYFFGVSVQPCHRALPDAQATSEVFLRLVELAQERGSLHVERAGGARRPAAAADPCQARAGPRGADAAGRLPVPRRRRARALRGQGARPPGTPALVLPLAAAAADGRVGARRGRPDRVAGARLRARGVAGGGGADPSAPAAREQADALAGGLRLPPPARGQGRHERGALAVRAAAAEG